MLRTYACIRVGESERKFDLAVFQIDLVQSQLLRNGSDGLFRLRHLRSAEAVVDRRCIRISEFVILNAPGRIVRSFRILHRASPLNAEILPSANTVSAPSSSVAVRLLIPDTFTPALPEDFS